MPRPVPPGLWRRVPPAVFPPILGLAGLALAWQGGVAAFALPPALAGLMAGMVVAVLAFAVLAYGVKLARRPSVLIEELRVLPGRAGLSAGVLAVELGAALVWPVAPGLAHGMLVAGLALHLGLIAALIDLWRAGPEEQRRVNPAWHLHLTGLIVAARVALVVGWPGLAQALVWPAAAAALAVYGLSLRQVMTGGGIAATPAPLRPMLAIHVAPLALFGTVALGLGWTGAGQVLAWLALAGALALAVSARWLTAGGFSALWGAVTFPLAATAGLWVQLWRTTGGDGARVVAGLLLVAATLVVLPIAFRILRDWANGRLPVKTNAAIA